MPKFMICVRGTKAAEAGEIPETDLLAEMLKYNTSLVDAGILVAGEGLLPSAKGVRVNFRSDDGQPTLTDGPFDVSTIISGFWLIKAQNLQEAVGWARKAPFRDDEAVLEVRQVAGADDFGDQMTAELRAGEQHLRERVDETSK
ncbi:DGPF-domain-containing protein [Thozetella sp. PMI_491]|nr:DGPF-domain-containing protein [Thozetella sp. PMI_491]